MRFKLYPMVRSTVMAVNASLGMSQAPTSSKQFLRKVPAACSGQPVFQDETSPHPNHSIWLAHAVLLT